LTGPLHPPVPGPTGRSGSDNLGFYHPIH
ncbi:hypothetical protein A2U01_0094228, partial [Trifolium medium]|nr:hypothetical protein [Trifolium medium]